MSASVRALEQRDVADVKSIIDETKLFPSEMIDEMVSPYLGGDVINQKWFVVQDTESTESLLGLAYYVPEKMTSGTFNLLLIAVKPTSQGKGVGKSLVAAVEQIIKADQGRLLLVETSGLPEYEKTRNFYVKLGFEKEATVREFYAEGEDKIVYRKKL